MCWKYPTILQSAAHIGTQYHDLGSMRVIPTLRCQSHGAIILVSVLRSGWKPGCEFTECANSTSPRVVRTSKYHVSEKNPSGTVEAEEKLTFTYAVTKSMVLAVFVTNTVSAPCRSPSRIHEHVSNRNQSNQASTL